MHVDVTQNLSNHHEGSLFTASKASRVVATTLICAGLLSACGKSKPSASDIEPYVMAELSNCPLWSVSNVRKLDGVEAEDSYQVDFSARLTLNASPEQTMHNYAEHGKEAVYRGCHFVIAQLFDVRIRAIPSKNYEISGAGELIKSESGWRLRGELFQLGFMPDADEVAARTEAKSSSEPVPAAVVIQPQAASEDDILRSKSAEGSSCLKTKMVAWEKQHASEVEQAAAAARAAGEEVRSSAGMEELARNDALAVASSECK